LGFSRLKAISVCVDRAIEDNECNGLGDDRHFYCGGVFSTGWRGGGLAVLWMDGMLGMSGWLWNDRVSFELESLFLSFFMIDTRM